MGLIYGIYSTEPFYLSDFYSPFLLLLFYNVALCLIGFFLNNIFGSHTCKLYFFIIFLVYFFQIKVQFFFSDIT